MSSSSILSSSPGSSKSPKIDRLIKDKIDLNIKSMKRNLSKEYDESFPLKKVLERKSKELKKDLKNYSQFYFVFISEEEFNELSKISKSLIEESLKRIDELEAFSVDKTVSKKVKTDEVEDHEEASKDEYDVDTNASENGVRKERFADLQSAIETSEDGDVKFENSHSEENPEEDSIPKTIVDSNDTNFVLEDQHKKDDLLPKQNEEYPNSSHACGVSMTKPEDNDDTIVPTPIEIPEDGKELKDQPKDTDILINEAEESEMDRETFNNELFLKFGENDLDVVSPSPKNVSLDDKKYILYLGVRNSVHYSPFLALIFRDIDDKCDEWLDFSLNFKLVVWDPGGLGVTEHLLAVVLLLVVVSSLSLCLSPLTLPVASAAIISTTHYKHIITFCNNYELMGKN